MSVYPPVGYGHGHGQSSYGGPSYSQHGGYYQQPPPPAPYYQQQRLDPISFRRDYQNRLAELTVNSRPIIQNLSMVAQEYSQFSEIVAQCLEAHIRRVSGLVSLVMPHNYFSPNGTRLLVDHLLSLLRHVLVLVFILSKDTMSDCLCCRASVASHCAQSGLLFRLTSGCTGMITNISFFVLVSRCLLG